MDLQSLHPWWGLLDGCKALILFVSIYHIHKLMLAGVEHLEFFSRGHRGEDGT